MAIGVIVLPRGYVEYQAEQIQDGESGYIAVL